VNDALAILFNGILPFQGAHGHMVYDGGEFRQTNIFYAACLISQGLNMKDIVVYGAENGSIVSFSDRHIFDFRQCVLDRGLTETFITQNGDKGIAQDLSQILKVCFLDWACEASQPRSIFAENDIETAIDCENVGVPVIRRIFAWRGKAETGSSCQFRCALDPRHIFSRRLTFRLSNY
jgi:hypothetical protein